MAGSFRGKTFKIKSLCCCSQVLLSVHMPRRGWSPVLWGGGHNQSARPKLIRATLEIFTFKHSCGVPPVRFQKACQRRDPLKSENILKSDVLCSSYIVFLDRSSLLPDGGRWPFKGDTGLCLWTEMTPKKLKSEAPANHKPHKWQSGAFSCHNTQSIRPHSLLLITEIVIKWSARVGLMRARQSVFSLHAACAVLGGCVCAFWSCVCVCVFLYVCVCVYVCV